MKRLNFSFLFLLTIFCFSFFTLTAKSQTSAPELETPPGYVPSKAPDLPVIKLPSAQSTPQFIPTTSESPQPSPTPNSAVKQVGPFQNPADISRAVSQPGPPTPDQTYLAPVNGPSYPPPAAESQSAKPNIIVDVEKKPVEKKIYAVIVTSMGSFKIKLFPEYAPRTVKNFTDLATGQKEFVEAATSRKSTRPFYNGQIIFKVVRNFVIQMGCPFGDGRGGPGFDIQDEFSPYLHHDKPGVVSMANHGANTAGSQFFITLSPQPSFDDKYSAFGQVISGMDVVTKISKVKTGPTSRPLKRIVISKIEIETK